MVSVMVECRARTSSDLRVNATGGKHTDELTAHRVKVKETPRIVLIRDVGSCQVEAHHVGSVIDPASRPDGLSRCLPLEVLPHSR